MIAAPFCRQYWSIIVIDREWSGQYSPFLRFLKTQMDYALTLLDIFLSKILIENKWWGQVHEAAVACYVWFTRGRGGDGPDIRGRRLLALPSYTSALTSASSTHPSPGALTSAGSTDPPHGALTPTTSLMPGSCQVGPTTPTRRRKVILSTGNNQITRHATHQTVQKHENQRRNISVKTFFHRILHSIHYSVGYM